MRLSATRAFLAACAVAFLAGHLPFLASTLEDIDSVNFALGVRDFDVAAHRPHPPGYPIFIALGKLSTPLIGSTVDTAQPGASPEARGLAFWGTIAGAVAAWPLLALFRAIAKSEPVARAGVVLTLTSPLVWFNASRPMSDLPGLALALAAQALFATAFVRQGEDRRARAEGVGIGGEALARSGRLIVLGALVAGLALGMRSQTAWLTLPLAAVVLTDRAGQDATGAIVGGAMAFAVGVLAWLVPLVVASGGPVRYLAALSSQAGEDLSGVDMFATNPTPRRMAFGLLHTFVQPWASVPLAAGVIVLAVVGTVLLLRRGRREAVLLAAVTVPYAIFHLVFQETVTTRYVLPLVPALALLTALALGAAGRIALTAGTAVLASSGLILAVPALTAYARQGSPLSRAIGVIAADSPAPPPALAMHHAFARAMRGEAVAATALPVPVKHEWLEVKRVLDADRSRRVLFLADPRRTDLALFDDAGRRLQASYRWPFDAAAFIGGVRPSDVDLWEITSPGWMAGEGWALTPETAGVATLDRQGPLRAPIAASVARRPEPARMLIGGRHLGQRDEPPMRVRRRARRASAGTLDRAAGVFPPPDRSAGWSIGRRRRLGQADDRREPSFECGRRGRRRDRAVRPSVGAGGGDARVRRGLARAGIQFRPGAGLALDRRDGNAAHRRRARSEADWPENSRRITAPLFRRRSGGRSARG